MERSPDGRLVCPLVPGHATESGFLDAISSVLRSRRNIQITDAGFFDRYTDDGNMIGEVVADPPASPVIGDPFVPTSRGIAPDGESNDEADDGDTTTIQAYRAHCGGVVTENCGVAALARARLVT